MDFTYTTESQLAWGALALLIITIVLSLLGERTIWIFGGDRELAGKVYKILFVGLGAGIMALVTPLAVTSFVGRLRSIFTTVPGASDSAIAQLLLRDNVPEVARMVGFALMVLFAVAGIVAAIDIWVEGGIMGEHNRGS